MSIAVVTDQPNVHTEFFVFEPLGADFEFCMQKEDLLDEIDSPSALNAPSPWPRNEATSASVSTPIPLKELIERLADLYLFRDYDVVSDFLRRKPFLIDLLFDAYGEIRRHLGQYAPIALQVFTEPEAEAEPILFALVRTNLQPAEALALLDCLDQDWWLDAASFAHGSLTIDVEY